jgi:hypothetical protein
MPQDIRPIDETAYPLRLFMGGLHVEVRLRQPIDAPASRRWFNALHAAALVHHLRMDDAGGVIRLFGADKPVRRSTGDLVLPAVMPGMGRRLLLWIDGNEAVARMRFWPSPGTCGYRVVVTGERHG